MRPASGLGILAAIAPVAEPYTVSRVVGLTPVLVAVLHRRVRDLIIANELVAAGVTAAQLMKPLNSKSEWAINKTIKQAMGWSPEELDRALEGVLDLDKATKGKDDHALSEGQLRLTFLLWLTDHVRPTAASPGRPAASR